VRVLIVEDNEALSDGVRRGLEAEGVVVDVSPDGVDGLWRAREFEYDAIVLDIMLPGVNGYEICRTLRGEGDDTPILMLTAKDGDFDIAEGLDLGADDYLVKPFSFVVLVARLRAVLRRAPNAVRNETVEVGPLSVDTVGRTCRLAGQSIDFTAREFSLLEFLLRRLNEPVTRSEILDAVWGTDADIASNVVDVYVGYVRRKLQTASEAAEVIDATVQIDAVRGVGYRLVRR